MLFHGIVAWRLNGGAARSWGGELPGIRELAEPLGCGRPNFLPTEASGRKFIGAICQIRRQLGITVKVHDGARELRTRCPDQRRDAMLETQAFCPDRRGHDGNAVTHRDEYLQLGTAAQAQRRQEYIVS